MVKELTKEHQDRVKQLRIRMFLLSINQRELARYLVEKGYYTEDSRLSLITSINYALTCYRWGNKYLDLIDKIENILDEYEKNLQG